MEWCSAKTLTQLKRNDFGHGDDRAEVLLLEDLVRLAVEAPQPVLKEQYFSAVVAMAEIASLQLGQGLGRHDSMAVGRAIDAPVVDAHEVAISGQPHVALE